MSAPQTLFLFWLMVTLVATPVLVFGSWKLLTMGAVHVPMFLSQIRKLLSANNRPRAIKLCMAVAESPYLRLTRYALEIRLPRVDPEGSGAGGYREGIGGQPLDARAREALQIQALAELAPVDLWWRRTMIAATPVVLASIPVLVARIGPIPAVLATLAVVLGISGYATLRRESIRRSMDLCVDTLTPCVLVEGDTGDEDSPFSAEPT